MEVVKLGKSNCTRKKNRSFLHDSIFLKVEDKSSVLITKREKDRVPFCLINLPYYMKFWRHFNLAILAIFQKIAKLKCTKIKCR